MSETKAKGVDPTPVIPPPAPTTAPSFSSALKMPDYIPGKGERPVGADFDRAKMRVKGPTHDEVLRNVSLHGAYYDPGEKAVSGTRPLEKQLSALEAEIKNVQASPNLNSREKGQRLRRIRQKIASLRAAS